MISKSTFESHVNSMNLDNMTNVNNMTSGAGLIPTSSTMSSGITGTQEQECAAYMDDKSFDDLLDSNENLVFAALGKKTPC